MNVEELSSLQTLNPFNTTTVSTSGLVVAVSRRKLGQTILSELTIANAMVHCKLQVYGDAISLQDKVIAILEANFQQNEERSYILRAGKSAFIGKPHLHNTASA